MLLSNSEPGWFGRGINEPVRGNDPSKLIGVAATLLNLAAALVTLWVAGWRLSLLVGGSLFGMTVLVGSGHWVRAHLRQDRRLQAESAELVAENGRLEVETEQLEAESERLEAENRRLEAESRQREASNRRFLGETEQLQLRNDELRIDNEQLKMESRQLEAENQQLEDQGRHLESERAGLEAEVTRLSGELSEMQTERKEYEEGLQTVIDRSQRPLREKLIVTCVIGETPDNDFHREDWETAAVDDERPVLWHRVSAGAESDVVPPRLAFRQLQDVEAYELYEGKEQKLRPLSLARRGGKIWAFINFDTEGKPGHPRRWWIQYRWPGIWNPLRMYCVDRHWLYLTEEDGGKGVEWQEVRVNFIFPSAARDPEVFLSIASEHHRREQHSDAYGRQVVSCYLKSPPCGLYRFDLRVRAFEPSTQVAKVDHPPGWGSIPELDSRVQEHTNEEYR